MTKKSKKEKAQVQKNVEQLNRTPLKAKPREKAVDNRTWLEKYVGGDTSKSAAKAVTSALTKGATIEQLLKITSTFKDNKWGKSKGDLTGHIRFLKVKGCQVKEDNGHFTVSM